MPADFSSLNWPFFGPADDFGAGMSRGGEKFDMVVGDLKTSA